MHVVADPPADPQTAEVVLEREGPLEGTRGRRVPAQRVSRVMEWLGDLSTPVAARWRWRTWPSTYVAKWDKTRARPHVTAQLGYAKARAGKHPLVSVERRTFLRRLSPGVKRSRRGVRLASQGLV